VAVRIPGGRLLDGSGPGRCRGSRQLAIKSGDGVFVLRRVLDYAGRPAVLDEITLPAALFNGLTRARFAGYPGSMYGFFETAFGVRMLRAEERLHAVAADQASANLLDVAPGTPLLAVERISFTRRPSSRGAARPVHDATRHYWNTL
jgi:GntR family transcriptional regulator